MFLFALLLTFAAYAGNMLVVDNPQPADVIVVLAGETDRRPSTRDLSFSSRAALRGMLLDVPSAAKIYNFTQVRFSRKIHSGSPSFGIDSVVYPRSRDSRLAMNRTMWKDASAGEPGNRILIVTSEFHTRRALSIFRHEISGNFLGGGFLNDGDFGTRWWTHREWSKTCFDEWIRLFWWNAVDRWR